MRNSVQFYAFFALILKRKKVAEFTGLNRGTVNNIFHKLRERIAEICEAESPFENGEIELDESYSGARRVAKSYFEVL